MATAGFPNLWMITGPGSPSVLSNMMISIEQHVDWIADAMTWARDHDTAALDPTTEAEDEWTDHVDEVGHTTLYPSANSWYMGSNVARQAARVPALHRRRRRLPRGVRRRRRQGLRRLHQDLTVDGVCVSEQRANRA